MAKTCEHTRQIMSVGYARCLECGAETTLTRTPPADPEAQPDPATPVVLTASQRRWLRAYVEQEMETPMHGLPLHELAALRTALDGGSAQ